MSMVSTTLGGLPKSGSVTTLALTCACPEKLTFSGAPITEPLTVNNAEVAVVVVVDDVEVEVVVLAEIVVCAFASEARPVMPAKNNDRQIFMCGSSVLI